ncbi:hypothetical protein Tco_1097652 [Tanacetum coccineum]
MMSSSTSFFKGTFSMMEWKDEKQNEKDFLSLVAVFARFFDPGYAGGAFNTEDSCIQVVIFVAPSTLGKERPKELEDGWYPGLMAFIC